MRAVRVLNVGYPFARVGSDTAGRLRIFTSTAGARRMPRAFALHGAPQRASK